MRRALCLAVLAGAMSVAVSTTAGAATSLTIDGSFKTINIKKTSQSRCPSGAGDECGVFQLVGLGPADYVYDYGPLFEPNGDKTCFDIDGTFTITLRSDGSSVSGDLTGSLCSPGNSHHPGSPAYGHPHEETDAIVFSGGTGQFAGLGGTVIYHEQEAGAHAVATLRGTLTDGQ